MIDINTLLNKTGAEDYFNTNKRAIFNTDADVSVNIIKRSHTYNPDNFNIYYEIRIGKKEVKVRLSASRTSSKEADFEILNYFYANNFDRGEFQVPKPLAFIKEDNLLIYQDVPGEILTKAISQANLDQKIKIAAKLLNKVHSLPGPNKLKNGDFLYLNFNAKEIEKYDQQLAKNLDVILMQIKEQLKEKPLNYFCHGDFNPNNLVFNQEVFIIDFSSTCFYARELDLASFLSHLQIMLGKNKLLENFEKLKNIFLEEYVQNHPFEQKVLDLLIVLIDLRLLEIAIIYKWADYNEANIPLIYQLLIKDIKKTSINVET